MTRTEDTMVARVRASYLYDPVTIGALGVHTVQSIAATNVYLGPGYTYSGVQYTQQQRTRVEIDLNVRVRGNDTFVGFEDVSGPITVGERVEVYESESGVAGEGKITEIDADRELVYLSVDWSSLREDGLSSGSDPSAPTPFTQLMFVGTPPEVTAVPQQSWIELVARPSLVTVGGTGREIFITAPLGESSNFLTGTPVEAFVEMRQNVLFRNPVAAA